MALCGQYPGQISDKVSDGSDEAKCAGLGLTENDKNIIDQLNDVWDNKNCISIFEDALYGSKTLRHIDADALRRIRGEMNNLFALYISNYSLSEPPENQFQEKLIDACRSMPGICDDFLNPYCQDCDRQTFVDDNLKTTLCGCFAPEKYVNTDVSRICDVMCSYASTIKLLDATSIEGRARECNQEVCIIDNISINSVNSRYGDVTFEQLCSNCKGGGCKCIIGTTNIPSNININQNCGTETCYEPNEDDPNILDEVPCRTDNSGDINIALIVIIFIIIIIIIIVIIFIYK